MKEDERLRIIQSIKGVGYSCISIDTDKTQKETLKMLTHKFGDIMELHFANGGDQNNYTIPEAEICNQLGIKLIDGLGDKIQSSSWLLGQD
jgi:D-beta-D-heptose 7-phosphate kinase/D-beta-D-heptose 1-phosphate adenosyltransferase